MSSSIEVTLVISCCLMLINGCPLPSSADYIQLTVNDVETCGIDKDVARFKCQFDRNLTARVTWVINSTDYSSFNLPENHVLEQGRVLTVRNIWKYNDSDYQCKLEKPFGHTTCKYTSNIGKLMIKCELSLNCVPYYLYTSPQKEILRNIQTTFNKPHGYNGRYLLNYSDSESGNICNLGFNSSPDCHNKSCRHNFEVTKSNCSHSSAITIHVAAANSNAQIVHTPVKIESKNKIVMVSINNSIVNCTFINKQVLANKSCTFLYGPETPGCENVSLKLGGKITNPFSGTIDIDLLSTSSTGICFVIKVNNGTTSLQIEGLHNISEASKSNSTIVVYYTSKVAGLFDSSTIVFLLIIFGLLISVLIKVGTS